jgi:hypothetical protein
MRGGGAHFGVRRETRDECIAGNIWDRCPKPTPSLGSASLLEFPPGKEQSARIVEAKKPAPKMGAERDGQSQ